jgi:hypothetical protein
VDQDVFRSTYKTVNERPCPYEKAILTNNAACSMAHKFCIAEREGVGCASQPAQADCLKFLDLLRERSRFALKSTEPAAALPHAKAMRIQVGGLHGIESTMHPERTAPSPIGDIRATIEAAIAAYGSLALLPFGEIVRSIAAYQGRRRTTARQRPKGS